MADSDDIGILRARIEDLERRSADLLRVAQRQATPADPLALPEVRALVVAAEWALGHLTTLPMDKAEAQRLRSLRAALLGVSCLDLDRSRPTNFPPQLGDQAEAMMLLLSWGRDMVRDDELLRALMFEIEKNPDPIFMFSIHNGSSDEDRIRYYHLRLLADAGFLEETGRYGGAFRMTNNGHDFLAHVRDDNTWGHVKKASGKLGGISVRLMGEVAYALAKNRLMGIAKEFGISID